LHLDPLPGGKGDELISRQVLRGALGFIVSPGRVELQKCVGVVSEKGVRLGDEIRRRGGSVLENGVEVPLIRVPTRQQWNLALLSAGKEGTNVIGHEVAVNDRPESNHPRLQ